MSQSSNENLLHEKHQHQNKDWAEKFNKLLWKKVSLVVIKWEKSEVCKSFPVPALQTGFEWILIWRVRGTVHGYRVEMWAKLSIRRAWIFSEMADLEEDLNNFDGEFEVGHGCYVFSSTTKTKCWQNFSDSLIMHALGPSWNILTGINDIGLCGVVAPTSKFP